MFLEQQIIILDWFLKDHVTLKTGGMMLKIQLWSQQYIAIEKPCKNWNNFSQYYSFRVFLIKQMPAWWA